MVEADGGEEARPLAGTPSWITPRSLPEGKWVTILAAALLRFFARGTSHHIGPVITS
ncbi:MAG: hypothetical protein OSB12_05985 [Planctomycetota bacterium]|nr:hypothetical protein [Planctomycetota bacterium]